MKRSWSIQSEFAETTPLAGVAPLPTQPAGTEEVDGNGQYVYRPSFVDPPVDESELDEDGFTAQDRADLAALRATYDRIAGRWQALSPRSRNRRLLQLAQKGTVPLVGLVHISAATQAVPSAGDQPQTGKGRGKRPRYPEGTLRPSAVTARADPRHQEDLDSGMSAQDAFKRHKSRFRALLHTMRSGKEVVPQKPLKQTRAAGALPPLHSRGRRHKEEMLWRLEQLSLRGIIPTREENDQAVNLDALLDYLEANFPPGHEREWKGMPNQWGTPPEQYASTDEIPEEGRPRSKARGSGPSEADEAPHHMASSSTTMGNQGAGPWNLFNTPADPGPSAPPGLDVNMAGADETTGDSPEEEIVFNYADMPPDYDE